MELLAKLGINWQLLLAQIANFVILLGVLSIFVYKPLLSLIDSRNERIKKAMENAKRLEKEMQQLEARRTEYLQKIDEEAGKFLERAKADAEQTKQEIIAAAKAEAEDMLKRGKQQLDDERTRTFTEIQQTVSTLIIRLTEKILEREFGPDDQKRLLQRISKDIPSLMP